MDCCKETKYNLLIENLRENHTSIIALMEIMNWTEEQSKQAIKFSNLRGNFVLLRSTKDPIFELSRKLALKEIPHQVHTSKK